MIRFSSTHAALRRDRLIILGALVTVTVLAWLYLGRMSGAMQGVRTQAWGPSDVLLTFAMWSVMMVGMMLPSASPMVLIFSSIARHRGDGSARLRTGLFVLGYLAVWTLYSVAATAAQWGLHTAALLFPGSASPYLAGGLLAAAGLFQLTPLKHACLHRCHTPIGFLMTEWRGGFRGAWVMGLRHGRYCVGCCWALMALMLVLGGMNLLWMAALAAFCLVEKIGPRTEWMSLLAGLLLIGWGAWIVAGALLA